MAKRGMTSRLRFGVSFYTLWAIRRVVLLKLMSFCTLKAFYSDEICIQDGFFERRVVYLDAKTMFHSSIFKENSFIGDFNAN